MSHASECDKCGTLFSPKLGCLTLGEVCVYNGKLSGEMDSWSDADFCPKCSAEILVLIGPALNGVQSTLQGKSAAEHVTEKSPTRSSKATRKKR